MKVLELREVNSVFQSHTANKCHTGEYKVATLGFIPPPPHFFPWGMTGWETVSIRFSTSLKLYSLCNLGCDYSETPLS